MANILKRDLRSNMKKRYDGDILDYFVSPVNRGNETVFIYDVFKYNFKRVDGCEHYGKVIGFFLI